MEDFQSSWPYDGDKASTTFLPPSSSLLDSQNFIKEKMYGLESPLFRPAQASKPNQAGFDRQIKEEEFVLDSSGGLKIEHQEINTQYFPNQSGNYPQLDGLLDGNHYLRMQDYDVEGYQVRRSRGPSFNFNKERRGSEDFFGAGVDFMRFFKNYGDQFIQETEGLQAQAVKTEFEGGYQGQDDNALGLYNFQNLPQGKDVHVKEHELDHGVQDSCNNVDPSEEAAADESTLQLSVQGSDAEHSVGNPLSSGSNGEGDYEPVIKKKRKTNGNQIVEIPKVPETKTSKVLKLKKSKSENKNAIYSITPKGNSLSLKIVKMPEAKETETASKQKIKKPTKESKIADTIPDKTKIEEVAANTIEKPVEMPQNTGAPMDQVPMMRSKSSILSSLFHGKTGSFSDLVAGLGLPAEVEEMLNHSKIFNNLQSSMSRKIGPLTVEERRIKVEKYFEKRKNRTWSKRINYDCRKRVADSRLRFKGRFVTKTQAFGMLAEEGIYPDPNKITESEIKELLEEKFGSDPVKKKEKDGDGRKNNGRPKKQMKLEDGTKIKEEDIQVKYELEESLEDTKSPTGSFDDDF